MNKRNILLIFCAFLAMLSVSLGTASAQDYDLSNMDDAQLLELIQAIMNKLDEPEEAIPSPTPTPIPAPTAAPQTIPDVDRISDPAQLNSLMQMILNKLNSDGNGDSTAESSEAELPSQEPAAVIQPENTPEAAHYQVYDNKKMILERVPDDRFIPKPREEKDSQPGKKKENDKENNNNHYEGEPCTPDGATWSYYDGAWLCRYG